MDDVSYDDSRGNNWENYSHEFDPKRLLVVALKNSSLPLKGDDLTDFTFQRAKKEGTFTTCDDLLHPKVRFIGTRQIGDDLDASIWEVTSDDPFFHDSNLGKVSFDIRQAHIEASPDRYVKRQETVRNDNPRAPKREPAFDDLQYYYENR